MSAHRRDCDKTKCMSFMIKDQKFLEEYNKIWDKVSNIIDEEFDSKPVYNGKIKKNFHNNKVKKEGSQCLCLSVILIDSVYKKEKDYYHQVFSEEGKFFVKGRKTSNFITGKRKISSNDSKEN